MTTDIVPLGTAVPLRYFAFGERLIAGDGTDPTSSWIEVYGRICIPRPRKRRGKTTSSLTDAWANFVCLRWEHYLYRGEECEGWNLAFDIHLPRNPDTENEEEQPYFLYTETGTGLITVRFLLIDLANQLYPGGRAPNPVPSGNNGNHSPIHTQRPAPVAKAPASSSS